MAEIAVAQTSSRNRRKVLSTRVDLTPMVDLGFLLLTFFVFSSVMTVPNTLHLTEPDDRQTEILTNVKESGALTLILGNNQQVYWYTGLTKSNGWNSSNTTDIRKVIAEKKLHTAKDDFVVLIKPSDRSEYKDLVNILNEMKLSVVDRYSIVDLDDMEKIALDNKEH